MKSKCFQLHLRPVQKGTLTELRLCGSGRARADAELLRCLCKQLSSLSGSPVELVLPVDEGMDEWFESWTSIVEAVPAHHLQIRFTLKPPRRPRGDDHVPRKP